MPFDPRSSSCEFEASDVFRCATFVSPDPYVACESWYAVPVGVGAGVEECLLWLRMFGAVAVSDLNNPMTKRRKAKLAAAARWDTIKKYTTIGALALIGVGIVAYGVKRSGYKLRGNAVTAAPSTA